MTNAAIIVAAGRGTRAGGPLPKQWQPLAGRRVIDWTMEAFLRVDDLSRIVLVLHAEDLDRYPASGRVEVVTGGATRAASVRAGLASLSGSDVRKVLIHDVARPCVSTSTILSCLLKLQDNPAVAPALPVTDALWRGEGAEVTGTEDRAGLYRAQTPQGFDYAAISAAHEAFEGEPADDVEVARAAGLPITILPGDEGNLKITTAEDFARADRQLRPLPEMRVGNGYDVHRFGAGDHVMLCGVAVPHDRGLQGHSDADVGLHALTDAIYGALAMGDIGQHFPPSDPQWKGADSHVFLRHAVKLASEKGFGISHLDVTLVCELPKIGPHATAMRAAVAGITGLDETAISVKATTSERLGFTGRGEGIAALATATLVRP